MFAFFNELSTFPHVASNAPLSAMDQFVDTCCALLEYGVKKIACEEGTASIMLSETETMHSYFLKNRRNVKIMLLMQSFSKPYIKDDSLEEEKFISSDYFVRIKDDRNLEHEIVNPMGIVSAHLYDSFSLSLASTEFWASSKILDLKIKKGSVNTTRKVRNVSDQADLNDSLRNLIAGKLDQGWPKTKIEPKNKTIDLSSDHHGNNKLYDFAKNSLRPLEYFIEVSTSLEYSPKCDHFVKAIYTDTMQIDVVLHKTEKGYGMRIKTTAENELQLRQIALDLEDRFGTGKADFLTLDSF